MRIWHWTALLGLLSLTACSDTVNCTLIGCENTFKLTVGSQLPLREGEYEIEVSSEGFSVVCAGPYPSGEVESLSCLAQGSVSRVMIRYARTSEGDSTGYEIDVYGVAPRTLAVTARLDGAEIANESVRPNYADVYPNGEQCGAACRVGTSPGVLLQYE